MKRSLSFATHSAFWSRRRRPHQAQISAASFSTPDQIDQPDFRSIGLAHAAMQQGLH